MHFESRNCRVRRRRRRLGGWDAFRRGPTRAAPSNTISPQVAPTCTLPIIQHTPPIQHPPLHGPDGNLPVQRGGGEHVRVDGAHARDGVLVRADGRARLRAAAALALLRVAPEVVEGGVERPCLPGRPHLTNGRVAVFSA